MMRIAIVGSREFAPLELVDAYVDLLPLHAVVNNGCARGVDSHAAYRARRRKLEVVDFPADWNRFGKRAGIVRNQEMLDASRWVVAFWDGMSRGTLDMMRRASVVDKFAWLVIPTGDSFDFKGCPDSETQIDIARHIVLGIEWA